MQDSVDKVLTPSQERFLFAVAGVVVPATSGLDERGRAQFAELISRALLDKPKAVARQFRIFLALVRWLPVFIFVRRFDGLGPARQASVLRFLESAPLALLRKGTWGLKTLIFMGYYGQPSVAEKVGYVPDFEGNRMLHAD